MRALLFFAMLLIVPTAFAAELVFRQGDDEVRITDKPCLHAGTMARIPELERQNYQQAYARVDGEMFYGCWRPAGSAVLLLYEDGDQGIVPAQAFQAAPGV